jgi:hypothetical protein
VFYHIQDQVFLDSPIKFEYASAMVVAADGTRIAPTYIKVDKKVHDCYGARSRKRCPLGAGAMRCPDRPPARPPAHRAQSSCSRCSARPCP